MVEEFSTIVARIAANSNCIKIKASLSILVPTIETLSSYVIVILESVRSIVSLENALTYTWVGA